MKHKTIRIKPGDHEHLRRMAQKQGRDMVDILAALVTEAEAGHIYKPLCGKARSHGTSRLSVPAELADKVNALKNKWGIYAPQVVTWLLGSADLVKPPDPMDTRARMEANRPTYERLIAIGDALERAGVTDEIAEEPYG